MNALLQDIFLWQPVSSRDALVSQSGVAALVEGRQIALFHLPGEKPEIFALDNWDPIGRANVLSRGIVGDIKGELVVASPLYKQHFSLLTGRCLEKADVSVDTYPVRIVGEQVEVAVS